MDSVTSYEERHNLLVEAEGSKDGLIKVKDL